MRNCDKAPPDWQPDIDRSVGEYNEWYLVSSPDIWAEARGRAVELARIVMKKSADFLGFDGTVLRSHPQAIIVARAAVSPVPARDRVIGFTGVSKSLVQVMERANMVPAREGVDRQLQTLAEFLAPLFDPGLFPWLREARIPTDLERDKALLVLGDRLTYIFYGPELRNEQERRQKKLMRGFLDGLGFVESDAAWDALQPGQFGMGRNVPGLREDGAAQNLPTDCVIRPDDPDLPLISLEMKSAGDFTNVNKRRKEESDKKAALSRAHGDRVVMLLQLFGYFDRKYLSFEAAAGLDWAWDHRLDDLNSYLR